MIQQPMYQQEQPESQELQQMVLCPVRVVYDTQMIMPPGEQMQQNQILIQSQHTPPWIQNRPQNQVIYVQQVPANYLPSHQQHIDQNQLYVQNYGYQIPQIMYHNPQDQMRQMQIVSNVMPNLQTNVPSNISHRMIASNIASIQNPINTINEVQSQNVPSNTQYINQVPNNRDLNNQKQQELSNPNVRHQVPQVIQEQRFAIPQSVTIQHNVQSVRLPQFESHNAPIRQMQPHLVAPNVQPTFTMSNTDTRLESKVPSYNVINTSNNVGRGPPIFRPIQPRPNYCTNFANTQTLPTNQAQPNVSNVNINTIPRKPTPNTINISNTTLPLPSYSKTDGNIQRHNRKRKSESPDDIHKKILVPNQNMPIIRQIKPPVSMEIGVNTSPIHKANNTIIINSLQITPIAQNTKLREELAKPIRNSQSIEPQKAVNIKMVTNPEVSQTVTREIASVIPTSISDKEKLIRNTVYTQARGRLLNDKEMVQEKIEETKELDLKPAENSLEVKPITENVKTESAIEDISINVRINKPTVLNNIEERERNIKCFGDEEVKEDKKSQGDVKEEIRFKENKDFVLTHVLDGYVIQESNVAFPIRRPLKEKTIYTNIDMEPKKEATDETEEPPQENKDILNIKELNLKEDVKNEGIDKPAEQDHPFKSIKTSTAKTWSVNELATHLSKFGWDETVAVLQEHEIDGESLFLVSKTQLMTIGVRENHAEVICEFVKS